MRMSISLFFSAGRSWRGSFPSPNGTSGGRHPPQRVKRPDCSGWIISKYHSIIFVPFTKSLGKKVKLAILLLLFLQYNTNHLFSAHQAQRRPLGGFKRQAVQDDDVWPAKGSDADQPQIQDIQVISHIGTCNLLTMSPRSSARRQALE